MRCLITGGSRGLGRAICRAFATAGARVAFTYRQRDDDADELVAELIDQDAVVRAYQGCVSDSSHVKAVITDVCDQWGGLDVLINNAAIMQVLPIALLEERDWDRMMAVNVKGPYLFARAALRPMIRARRGHIINVGTFGGDRVLESPVHYATSKAALLGFTRALAKDVGRYGIQVNIVQPGLMDTGASARLPAHRRDEYASQVALRRLIPADDVASMCVDIAAGDAPLMSGARIPIDGGL